MPASREPVAALAAWLAHPAPAAVVGLAAASAALTADLVDWAVTLLPARKRLTWEVALDMPVGLTPGRPPDADWTVTIAEHGDSPGPPDPDASAEGWLLLAAVTNTGLAPVRGDDFEAPLAFWFPGREVCAIQIGTKPARLRSRRRPPVPPAAFDDPGRYTAPGSSRAPGVTLGSDLLLHRNDAFTLMAVLRGTPARSLPPVSLEGALRGGAIVATEPNRPPARRWVQRARQQPTC